MNITVIFTGGTIASCENDGYLGPTDAGTYRILSLYKERFAAVTDRYDIEFTTKAPYRILSENLNGTHINRLVSCIRETLAEKPLPADGIIVTHGTDTLQYTAAALALACADTPVPIVLVSSNYILDDARANGLENFAAAVDYISGKSAPGVFAAYANAGGKANIYDAFTLLPHMPYSDSLYAVGHDGDAEDKVFSGYDGHADGKMLSGHNGHADGNFLSGHDIREDKPVIFSEQSPVLFIKAVPGCIYPPLTDNVKAVLLESYHSGTLATDDAVLARFAGDAHAKNIPLFLTGACNRTAYESTKAYEKLHIRVLPKASPIAMYMKLWYLYSVTPALSEEEIAKRMQVVF